MTNPTHIIGNGIGPAGGVGAMKFRPRPPNITCATAYLLATWQEKREASKKVLEGQTVQQERDPSAAPPVTGDRVSGGDEISRLNVSHGLTPPDSDAGIL